MQMRMQPWYHMNEACRRLGVSNCHDGRVHVYVYMSAHPLVCVCNGCYVQFIKKASWEDGPLLDELSFITTS
jgi:hypothetical protein